MSKVVEKTTLSQADVEHNEYRRHEAVTKLDRMIREVAGKNFFGSIGLTIKVVDGKLNRVKYLSELHGD